MYATVDDIKLVRGKETMSVFTSSRVNFSLKATKEVIDGILGGDFIELKQRTQRFDKCLLKCKDGCACGCFGLLFDGVNVVSIDKIDGQTYTGVAGIDYVITEPNNRKVDIGNFPVGLLNNEFCTFEVAYTSGYDPVPVDIVYAQSLLVVGEMSKADGQELKSYKLRERTVTFKDEGSFLSFKSILGRYQTLTI